MSPTTAARAVGLQGVLLGECLDEHQEHREPARPDGADGQHRHPGGPEPVAAGAEQGEDRGHPAGERHGGQEVEHRHAEPAAAFLRRHVDGRGHAGARFRGVEGGAEHQAHHSDHEGRGREHDQVGAHALTVGPGRPTTEGNEPKDHPDVTVAVVRRPRALVPAGIRPTTAPPVRVSGGAVAVGTRDPSGESCPRATTETYPTRRRTTVAAMRILVIGGTRFIGRHVVEQALARGHEVTLFHRGRTGADLFPDARAPHRRPQHRPVGAGRRASGTPPSTPAPTSRGRCTTLADALGGRGGHHLLVSSVSAYATARRPGLRRGRRRWPSSTTRPSRRSPARRTAG